MKLRNKKTGEIIDLDIADIKAQFGGISVIPEPAILGGDEYVYHSLAELNSDWEDYAPAEPLIKDEKIRKAVRAWAEALDIEYAEIIHDGSNCEVASYFCGLSIEFDETAIDIKDGHYTIAELCGEEEE